MSKATLFGLVLACSPVVGALAFESYPGVHVRGCWVVDAVRSVD
jgi:hypothetical protein